MKRYQKKGLRLLFRGDAAFAKPELYEYLEQETIGYAVRLAANAVLQREIAHLLVRPTEWPSRRPIVSYHDFTYQAQSWSISRRVVAKVEWHQGELFGVDPYWWTGGDLGSDPQERSPRCGGSHQHTRRSFERKQFS